jgi:integrase/recombinase XerD
MATKVRNLTKRGDVYYVRVMIDGRRIWRSTGKTTEKSAQRQAERMLVQLRDKDFARARPVPTYREWTVIYEQTYTAKLRRPEHVLALMDATLPAWGSMRLDQITKSMVVRFLDSTPIAGATRNLRRAILRAIFERAKEDGLVQENPVQAIERLKVGPRIRVLTPESEARLRQALRPQEQRWLTFMLGTGLRIGEARAITPAMVDRARRRILVPAEAAKGGKARVVPLWPEVQEAIDQQLAAEGALWHNERVSYHKLLDRAQARAKIAHFSPHDLRHTFATRYLQRGGNIFTLSKILGHATVKITEETYVHLTEEDVVSMALREVPGGGAATFGATNVRPFMRPARVTMEAGSRNPSETEASGAESLGGHQNIADPWTARLQARITPI